MYGAPALEQRFKLTPFKLLVKEQLVFILGSYFRCH